MLTPNLSADYIQSALFSTGSGREYVLSMSYIICIIEILKRGEHCPSSTSLGDISLSVGVGGGEVVGRNREVYMYTHLMYDC